MAKFLMTKGHDAYVYFTKEFEAESFEQAVEMAHNDRYNDGWAATDEYTVYDDAEIMRDRSELISDKPEEQTSFHTWLQDKEWGRTQLPYLEWLKWQALEKSNG